MIKKSMIDLEQIYKLMLGAYGKQGWWPVYNMKKGASEYGTGAPVNDEERFEIIIGAILTQNVAWKNVEKALGELKKNRILSPRKLHKTDNSLISTLIRPAGYYNQKTLKIKNFLNWFRSYNYSFEKLARIKTPDLRAGLLSINGIGPETADSVLLYALGRKIFVIDAYTKRIFSRLNPDSGAESYDSLQVLFHNGFKCSIKRYNEFHALIVAHGKDVCKNKPLCPGCCLKEICFYYRNTN